MVPLRDIKCFALDMDGTIYLGDKLLDGAKEFLDYLKDSGRKYIFLTNNSSKNKQAYIAKLDKLGIVASEEEVLTSGAATILYLQTIKPCAKVFLLGTPSLEAEFTAAGFVLTAESPDFVVLGFDMTLDYAKLTEACHLLREGVPFIATHPDINCPTNERSGYLPDVGAMLEMIYASTGVRAKIIGKPNKEMITALAKQADCSFDKMAMVGDRLYTDVQMAVNAGITGVLVLSGESTVEDIVVSDAKPDYIFPSVKELNEELQKVDGIIGKGSSGLGVLSL